MDNHPENFAYVFNQILFVGINLVGGIVHDVDEWETRHQANLDWIDNQYDLHQNEVLTMVILAHSDPDISNNDNFFATFFRRVEQDYALLVVFVHRNLGVEVGAIEPAYNGIANFMVVIVAGSVWPPMLLEVDPFAGTVQIDQDSWYTDYLSTSAIQRTNGP
jgi:hypothetical protein